MTSHAPPVTILTSAVGLGLYIPAVLIARQLGRRVPAEVEVLEGYYAPQFQQTHDAHREAHHASFALAQLAHRMARPVEHCLDTPRVESLLERWREQGRSNFIVWAGFWLPVLEQYRRSRRGAQLEVDHCRIDAVVSASFRVHPELDATGRSVWLWNGREGRLEHEIPVTTLAPMPFSSRADRLVVHGGGWNIGSYREVVPELSRAGFHLDVVVHDLAEVPTEPGSRAFMLDPEWRAWRGQNASSPSFPPMREVTARGLLSALPGGDHHALHDVIRGAKAIVSKPGGCTLIDSLAAATPVVLLEPYGYAEAANAKIWADLGFGISYGSWRESGFDRAILDRLHANLLARPRGMDYPRAYAERLLAVHP